MNWKSKLKPVNEDKQIWLTILVSLGMVVIFVVIGAMYGEPFLDRFIAVMMAGAAWLDLMIMIRTRNTAFIPAFLWQGLMAGRLLSRTENKTFIAFYAAAVWAVVALAGYLARGRLGS